jgi:hypothetical protein
MAPSGGNFGQCASCCGDSSAPACQEQLFERQGCDDTNGDGIADVTYTQIWAVPSCSVTANARLVGSYLMGDFAAPYTPVNPVDCSGLVDEDTTGSTPVATVGLCLASGTPIAVTVVRDCDGIVTQTGWINLNTGTWNAGNPPPGTVSCGGSQSIQVSGVFCDVLAGEVVGLVLVEYEYAADGSIANVRLVDAATGTTYVLQGELSVCPAGGPGSNGLEVELLPLCVTDNVTGAVLQRVVAEWVYDTATGTRTAIRIVDAVTGAPAPVPGGASLTACPLEVTPTLFQHQEILCDSLPSQMVVDGDFTDPNWLVSQGGAWTQIAGTNGALPGRYEDVAPHGFFINFSPETGVLAQGAAIQQIVTVEPGEEYDLSLEFGKWAAGGTTNTVGRVQVFDGSGAVLFEQTVTVTGGTDSGVQWLPSGVLAPVRLTATDATMRIRITDLSVENQGQVDLILDNVSLLAVEPVRVPFIRKYLQDAAGAVTDVVNFDLEGAEYEPVGEVVVCPNTAAPCETAAVQILQLCDLNPQSAPNSEGQICATPFLRRVVYACDGTPTSTDFAMDGVTPYFPVAVVSCDGSPSLVELEWPQTGITGNNAGGTEFDFTLTNPRTGDAANVHLTSATPAGQGGCAPAPAGTPPTVNAPGGNPNAASLFTYTLDAVAQQADQFRVEFIDLDVFEGVRSLTPTPDGVYFTTGAGTWNGAGQIDATVANSTAVAYWNTPPAQIAHFYRNAGGGTACHAPSFQAMTFESGPPCGSTPQVFQHQEVLCDVIDEDPPPAVPVNAAPNVPTWTLVEPDPANNTALGPVTAQWPGGFIAFQGDGPVGVMSAYKEFTGLYPGATYQLTWLVGQGGAGTGLDPRVEAVVAGTGGAPVIAASGPVSADAVADGNSAPAPPLSFVVPADGIVRLTFFDRSTGNSQNDDVWVAGTLLTPTDVPPAGEGDAVPFIRKYVEDAEGNITGILNYTLDGDSYDPVGMVAVCPSSDSGAAAGAELDRLVQALCDVTAAGVSTAFLRHWQVDNATGDLTLVGNTLLDGTTAYNPAGTVTVCGNQQETDRTVGTGMRRLGAADGNVNFKTLQPGLQSATLTVLAGAVTASGSDGTVIVPSGVSLTWSVNDTDDSSLGAVQVTGQPGSDYIVNYTYKTTAAG